jgi:hypothetical protein
MSAQERFNHITGRKEFYIDVEGLPGYWTALGLCDRCYAYKKCLGLAKLSMEDWQEFEKEYTIKNIDLVEINKLETCP